MCLWTTSWKCGKYSIYASKQVACTWMFDRHIGCTYSRPHTHFACKHHVFWGLVYKCKSLKGYSLRTWKQQQYTAEMHERDTHSYMKHWVILLYLIKYLRGGVNAIKIEEFSCHPTSHWTSRVCSYRHFRGYTWRVRGTSQALDCEGIKPSLRVFLVLQFYKLYDRM